jgi:hypothetical protein
MAIRLFFLDVVGKFVVVVFVHTVMFRPGIVEPRTSLTLKGGADEGSLTGKGMEFGVEATKAGGLGVAATLDFLHLSQGRVHVGFDSFEELVSPLEFPDLLVAETCDPGYLHLQVRARLRRRRRSRWEDRFRSFDFGLKTLHCLIGGLKPDIEETLADGAELFQVSQLLGRRGCGRCRVSGRLRRTGFSRRGGGQGMQLQRRRAHRLPLQGSQGAGSSAEVP